MWTFYRSARRTTVLFAIALCALAFAGRADATNPRFNGDIISPTLPVFNVLWYGAKGDDATDDTTAINNAIAAAIAAGGGTIYFPRATYLVNGVIAIPYTLSGTLPKQPPLRFTGDGANWNSYLTGSVTSGGSALDLRYAGTAYNAKINSFGGGRLEIDHLTLEDNGTDNWPFFVTTETTLLAHDDACIGNPGHSGASSNQDCWILGENGYTATNASITSGTKTLTIGAGDPPFNANMVGWDVGIVGAGNAAGFYSGTISAYISPTQVTLSANAGTTVSAATAYYFGSGNDVNAAFQGYGTHLYDNFYSRIRRGITFNQWTNSVQVDNETYALDCGSSEIYGAAYYLQGVPGFVNGQFGVRIFGSTIEVQNYPYAISMQDGSRDNLFDGIAVWDSTAGFKSIIYSAVSQGPAIGQSLLIAAHTDMSPIVYASGPSSNTISVITGEQNQTSVLANGLIVGQPQATSSPSSGTITAASGTSSTLNLNTNGSSSPSGVNINFNTGAINDGGLTVWDGSNSVYGQLKNTGLFFSQSGSTYGAANANIVGHISAVGHNTCGSSSGILCETTVTCSISSGTTCNGTVTVPSGAICTATPNASDTTTGEYAPNVSLSSTTLTVKFTVSSSQTSTAAANVTCL